MEVSWRLRRGADLGSSTNHTIEFLFKLPPNFAGGGTFGVPGMWMKPAERLRGTALAGLAAKLSPGYFFIGLSAAQADNERNLRLLKDRPWIDIPIVYTNNRRALLAIEKGCRLSTNRPTARGGTKPVNLIDRTLRPGGPSQPLGARKPTFSRWGVDSRKRAPRPFPKARKGRPRVCRSACRNLGTDPRRGVPFVCCRGELDRGEIRDWSDFCQFGGFYPSH